MPEYFDSVSIFGLRGSEPDPHFFKFRHDTHLTLSPDLGSGRHFQISYNLVAPAFKETDPTENSYWSLSQAAIHHQFDCDTGKTLWMITHGRLHLYDAVCELLDVRNGPEARNISCIEGSFRISLAVHMVHIRWAKSQWTPYLKWLTWKVDEKVRSH